MLYGLRRYAAYAFEVQMFVGQSLLVLSQSKETKLEVQSLIFYMGYINVHSTDWHWQRALYALHEGELKNMAESPKQGMPTTPLMQGFQEPNEMRTPSWSQWQIFLSGVGYVWRAPRRIAERGLWPSGRVKQPTTHTYPHRLMALPASGD